MKWYIFTSFITGPEFVRVVVLSKYSTYCHQQSPEDQTHRKSRLFLLPPWSGLQWEPYNQVALHTDGRRGQDAGIHVDEMGVNKESTHESLGQAEEGFIDPKGKEEDEGRISHSQVEHVDVGVCPGVPLGDEGTQSSSIDEESQEKRRNVSQTLQGVHSTSRVGDDGDVGPHAYL